MAEKRRMLETSPKFAKMASESAFAELARRHFAMLENCLNKARVGPTWLLDSRIANIVAEALHYRDGKKYRLDAYSIMPNHVHVVFAPSINNGQPLALSSIMHSLKRNTAKLANRILERTGAFWEHESFDHYIRNQREFNRIVKYVLQNPVKAGLVKTWNEWPWNYVRESLGIKDAN